MNPKAEIVVMDGDSISFIVAAASETKEMIITNKITGEQMLEEGPQMYEFMYIDGSSSKGVEPVKEKENLVVSNTPVGETRVPFKNITSFKGRSKKKIGGYLEKINEERVESGLDPYTVDDFEYDEKYTADDLRNAKHSVKMKINAIFEHCKQKYGVSSYMIVMGEGDTFRQRHTTA